MTTTKISMPEAYIAVAGNRQKIYPNAKIYLNGGTEFQIELFNPTTGVVAAKIFINDEPISSSLIVLRPGVREYLDRYIDENRKFLFDTYKVENTKESKEAIADNGKISVQFFKAKSIQNITFFPNIVNIPSKPYWGTNQPWCGDTNYWCGDDLTNQFCTDNLSFNNNNLNEDNIETGRVEGGDASDQSFINYNGEFESFMFYEQDYQILPASTQPVEVSKIRQYCHECGNRIRKSSWRFCPACGETLE